MISLYYRLTKPGIIYGNGMSAVAGYFIAARWHFDLSILFSMIAGLSLIIAAGCVFNNYLDRDIDAHMDRTKKRALVTGTISPARALLFGSSLGILGTIILFVGTNVLALFVALLGLFAYVVIYSMWCKRYTLHATLIGAIAGAVPPVVGYVSVTGTLDVAACILFLILMSWQMPHALAITIRRRDDYLKANIPVMPIARSVFAAKLQIASYAFVFLIATLALAITGYAGKIYLVVMGGLAFAWLLMSLQGFTAKEDTGWAKRIFLFSLIVMTAFCVLCALDASH